MLSRLLPNYIKVPNSHSPEYNHSVAFLKIQLCVNTAPKYKDTFKL